MRIYHWSWLLGLAACGGEELLQEEETPGQAVVAAACSAAKNTEILAAATAQAPSVNLDCSPTLPANRTITKKVIIQGTAGSGVTLDCAGGRLQPTQSGGGTHTITIRSVLSGSTWRRPQDVTVRNCTVHGSIRIMGLGSNGEAIAVRDSSRLAGHTARAQAAAPTNILLSNLHIIGAGTIPLYLAPGTTRVTFQNSEISGTGTSVAIYLDAESGHHVIRNNNIHLDSEGREQLAVDGSAYNKIFSNRFSGLDTGGIYLYRNCGEGGTVRHQSPVHNEIFGNVFYYNAYRGFNPAIFVASRNGWRSYCDDDNGYPFGSSVDNRDLARENVIAENQIYVRSVSDMIQVNDSPNHLYYNVTVSDATPRTPGCFLELPHRNVYLRHGESYGERNPPFVIEGTRYTCQNNQITANILPLTNHTFSCARAGSNDGCAQTVSCPAGRQLVSLRAACNLETETLAASEVTATGSDQVRVARQSDSVSDGRCMVGTTAISSGSAPIHQHLGFRSTPVSCRERDQNGGDCVIRGEYLCL